MKTLIVVLALGITLVSARVTPADNRAGGVGTINNVVVNNVADENTDVWEILLSKAIFLAFDSTCVATACSDLANPGRIDSVYRYAIDLNDTSPGLNTTSERSQEFDDNAGIDDKDFESICTAEGPFNVAGGQLHTVYLLAAKATAAMPNLTVNDSRMTIVCVDGAL